MKIRSGFVSNSSSSSFIVAFKQKNDICPCCGRQDFNIIDLIKNSYDEDNNVKHDNSESVINSINRELDDLKNKKSSFFSDIEVQEQITLCLEQIDKIQNYVKEGYEVIEISLSDHDETLRTILGNEKIYTKLT